MGSDADVADRFMNRKAWPPGEWDSEPDREEFRHAGFPCLVVRGPMGALCGYTAG